MRRIGIGFAGIISFFSLPALMSRITVRRAISELEREGLVVTRQGAGTFVADPSRAAARSASATLRGATK